MITVMIKIKFKKYNQNKTRNKTILQNTIIINQETINNNNIIVILLEIILKFYKLKLKHKIKEIFYLETQKE